MAIKIGASVVSSLSCFVKFDRYYTDFCTTDNYVSLVDSLSNMYSTLRTYGTLVLDTGVINFYDRLLNKIEKCERRLGDSFIIESKPDFNYNDPIFMKANFNQLCTYEKLDYIVWLSRRSILRHINDYYPSVKSLDNEHLANECRDASYRVCEVCNRFNLQCKVIKIPAALSDDINLYGGNGYHYFVMAAVDGKEFIIDCTYRQFFRSSGNNLERLGVVGRGCSDPGLYMIFDSRRRYLAKCILKNGWVEATPLNFKDYLDGFMLSFRNGKYYEILGKVDYSVDYSAEQYIDFLFGDDIVTRYEPREGLGTLNEPIKDRSLVFNK